MSKILITGIGTGRTNEVKKSDGRVDLSSKREYEKITYIIEEKEYNTAFVAKALIQHYNIDKVFFIGTAGSMWEEIYKSYKKDFDEDTYFKIAAKIEESDYQNYSLTEDDLKAVEEAIDESLGNNGSRCFLIKYGLNEQELFYNFKIMQKIEELLEDNDEIYLDITHSFRSLSLFQYVMINFAQNLSSKNLKVNGVFYGMLEAKKYYNNKAPVVNLSKVYEISNWIKAIHELDKYGNGYLVSELLKQYDNELSKKISLLSDVINLNYLSAIKSQHEKLQKADFNTLDGPMGFANVYIKKFIDRFSNIKENSMFQLELANWYYENKRYATCYITMLESIVTKMCELMNVEWHDKKNRKKAKKILNFNIDSSKNYVGNYCKIFSSVSDIRNNIAHALEDRDESNCRNDINNGKRYYEKLKEIYPKLNINDFKIKTL